MKPVTVPNAFATQTGPIPLSQLDADLQALATAVNDFATYGNYLVDSSATPNLITVTTAGGLSFAYQAGEMLQVKIANTNTATAVSINVNALGNQTIVIPGFTLVGIGQLVAGSIVQLQYDGTNFELMSPGSVWLFGTGSALNPSISFQAYPHTGIYNAGSNAIGFSNAGVASGTIDAFGHWSIPQPQAPGPTLGLTCFSAGSALLLSDGTTLDSFLGFTPAHNLQISGGATHGVEIDANGIQQLLATVAGVQVAGAFGCNGHIAAADTGWGTPTGGPVVPNFPGGTATLAQTSQAVARLIAVAIAYGFLGA